MAIKLYDIINPFVYKFEHEGSEYKTHDRRIFWEEFFDIFKKKIEDYEKNKDLPEPELTFRCTRCGNIKNEKFDLKKLLHHWDETCEECNKVVKIYTTHNFETRNYSITASKEQLDSFEKFLYLLELHGNLGCNLDVVLNYYGKTCKFKITRTDESISDVPTSKNGLSTITNGASKFGYDIDEDVYYIGLE